MEKQAKIGILRWESGLVPRGLEQLEGLKGNSTNPASYPFPVEMVEVPGACTETIITHPSREVMQRMIGIGKDMQSRGIKAVFGSCGFNAIFQREIAAALDIPVFMSSILQIPFVQQAIGKDKSVAVMTAYGSRLTAEHFACCGVNDKDCHYRVLGLEECPEWNHIFDREDQPVDMALVEREIMDTALNAVKRYPDIGAFVLECTDLPPYAPKIREETGLPVYSIHTMIGYTALMLGEISLY